MKFELAGLVFSEPITALGNFLLALACFYAFRETKRVPSFFGSSSWGYFFLALGSSTFIGVFSHLFSSYDVIALKLFGWVFSGLTAYFAQVASLEQLTKKKTGKLIFVSKVEFVLFLIALYWFQTFTVVLFVTVISLLTVIVIHSYGIITKSIGGSQLILVGFIASALTAVGRLFNLSIDPVWFNHHDVAHLFMIVSALIILAGVKKAAHSIAIQP